MNVPTAMDTKFRGESIDSILLDEADGAYAEGALADLALERVNADKVVKTFTAEPGCRGREYVSRNDVATKYSIDDAEASRWLQCAKRLGYVESSGRWWRRKLWHVPVHHAHAFVTNYLDRPTILAGLGIDSNKEAKAVRQEKPNQPGGTS